MKFFLFKILLIYRTKDQGFTLPMVIGIGLIMVLLSSISLLQASEENVIAISKTQSSTSLAMAELGVARYRELLNNNRVLAVNSLDNWANVATETCEDVSGAWVDTVNWFDITFDETVIGVDINGDGDQTDTNESIGRTRIVDYIYDNDGDPTDAGENGDFNQISDDDNIGVDPDGAGPLPAPRPSGILTVQGQAPDSDSIAQIEVTIPIGVNTDDLQSLDPGIWIHQETITNWGTIDLQDDDDPLIRTGNVVLYRQTPGINGCDNLDTSALGGGNTITAPAPNVAIRDPRDLPPLAPDPAGLTNSNPLASDITTLLDPLDPSNEVIIGKPSDNSNSDDGTERYYYRVGGNLVIEDGENIITDGTARVLIYVDGDLDISGDVNITNSSDAATSRFLEIHVTGNVRISGSGTINIKGLIHTPNGRVDITGNPTVNLTGSIWADDWASAGTVNVTTSEYEHYSITPQRTPKPLTFAPTGWEQQEAN